MYALSFARLRRSETLQIQHTEDMGGRFSNSFVIKTTKRRFAFSMSFENMVVAFHLSFLPVVVDKVNEDDGRLIRE